MGIYLGANALGGGGEGSGINSYAPFLVGTADNNPQGYIHSTGVYTNPIDESVWLKTGKTVNTDPSVYPNSFSVAPTQTQLHTQYNSARPQSGTYLSRNTSCWTQVAGARGPYDDLYCLGQGSAPYDVSTVFRYEYNPTPADPAYPWEYNNFNFNTVPETTLNMAGLAATPTHFYIGGIYPNQEVYQYTSNGSYTSVNLNVPSDIPGWGNTLGRIAGIEADLDYVYVVWYGTAGAQVGLAYILKYTHTGIFVSIASITRDLPTTALKDISFFNSTEIILSYSNRAIQLINATTGVTRPINQTSLVTIDPQRGFTVFSSQGANLEKIAGGENGQELMVSTFDTINSQFGDGTARTDSSGSGQPLFIKLK